MRDGEHSVALLVPERPALRADTDSRPEPRVDYVAISQRLPAAVIDRSICERFPYRTLAHLDRKTRLAFGHALAALPELAGAEIVISLSEDIAIPTELLLGPRRWRTTARFRRTASPDGTALRSLRHIMIGHSLLAPSKVRLFRALGVMPRFARILVVDPGLPATVAAAYGLDPARVTYLPNAVDRSFWRPDSAIRADQHRAISIGRARRDYSTLLAAIADTPVELDVHASSQWQVAYDSAVGPPPPNVSVTTAFQDAVSLRERIARTSFAIVPLKPGAHASAGSISILEAMAMGKPVILAVSDAKSALVDDGNTGFVVPAGDVAAMRSAVMRLVSDPDSTRAMGKRASEWVAQHADFDARIEQLVDIVHAEAST